MQLPHKVKIVEVGPRDGLQNEKTIIPTNVKINFIEKLAETGLRQIEATSFVSPKWIPQLADHRELFSQLKQTAGVRYPVLIPNVQGLKIALDLGVKDIAVFTTPSEQFSLKNTNCSVAESMQRITEVVKIALAHQLNIRGYISCVIKCPYEGDMAPHKVAGQVKQLIDLGCEEISLGDTIGQGTPIAVIKLIEEINQGIALSQLAVHFHDTYGQAIANIFAALQCGISIIDSSIAGLGGCPYAKGSTGNVATEDVVYLLNGLGIETLIDLPKLVEVGQFICKFLGKTPQSRVNLAMSSH